MNKSEIIQELNQISLQLKHATVKQSLELQGRAIELRKQLHEMETGFPVRENSIVNDLITEYQTLETFIERLPKNEDSKDTVKYIEDSRRSLSLAIKLEQRRLKFGSARLSSYFSTKHQVA